MHLIALIPIILIIVGGSQAAALLTAPVTALLAVHSLAQAGVIVEGMSIAQKIEAVRVLISLAQDAHKLHKQLHPVHAALLAKLQADIKKHHGPHGGGRIVAAVHGEPLGWGREPVTFIYDPEGGHDPALRPGQRSRQQDDRRGGKNLHAVHPVPR